MKNEEYIKEHKLEKNFKIYVNEKIEEAYNKLKAEYKINLKPALTKNEKILFISSTNFYITLEAIRKGRELKKLPLEEAIDNQRKKIKKIVNKIDKEHELHLQNIHLVKQIEETLNTSCQKKLFNKFINKIKETPMPYEEALQLKEEFINKYKGKDLRDALNISVYGKDYNPQELNIDNEKYSISNEEKDIEYAVLYYITGESLDYANNLLENNFVSQHKMYNE